MVKLVCHRWPPSPYPVSVPKHLALLVLPSAQAAGISDFPVTHICIAFCSHSSPVPEGENACFPAPMRRGRALLLAPQGGEGPERSAPRRGDTQKEASCLIPNHFSKNKNYVQMNISIFISNSRFQLQY